jgi:hypothetical protein
MSRDAEALRQQMLLQALQATPMVLPPGALPTGSSPASADRLAGLRAYRANAQAIAERALAAAYPVLAQVLGDEPMRALARDLWRDQPPLRGDLACFGEGLPMWLPEVAVLADTPWLADLARLEWAVHAAQAAADAPGEVSGLQRLAEDDPDRLRVGFVPGSAGIASAWPVLTLWRAHQVPAGEAPDLQAAREALSAGQGQAVWVWRRGLQVELAALDGAAHAFNTDLLAGLPLGPALNGALTHDPDFSFEHWLTRALREGWLAQFHPLN